MLNPIMMAVLARTPTLTNKGGGGGGGGEGVPAILFTDTPTIPTHGGEDDNGGYLSIYGRNFDLTGIVDGTTKVYIGGSECAAYKFSTSTPLACHPLFGIQQITVQVGHVAGLSVGTPGAVQVVTAGGSSNTDITVTPTGGRVCYVRKSGSDGSFAADDIAHPARHLQVADNSDNITFDVLTDMQAGGGDQVVIGEVEDSTTWTDVAKGNAWYRFRYPYHQGSSAKRVHFTCYPGATVHYRTPAGTPTNTATARYRGGIHGAEGSFKGDTGDYVCISNLEIDSRADSGGDSGACNSQSSFYEWWVTNVKGTWPSTATDGSDGFHAKAGLYSGHAARTKVRGCHAYAYYCAGALENHGYYFDSPETSTNDASAFEVGWCWAEDIQGGNGIQFFDNLGSAAAGGSNWHGFTGCSVHDCIFDGYGKYGLNLADNFLSGQFYNLIITNGTYAAMRFEFHGDVGTSHLDIDVFNVSVYNCDQLVSGSGNSQALVSHTGSTTGAVRVRNCVFQAGANTIAGSDVYSSQAGAVSWITFDANVIRGTAQGWTTSSAAGMSGTQADTHVVVGDPKFNAPTSNDFSLQASSPAIDAAVGTLPITLSRDIGGNARPNGVRNDCGAYEFV